MPYLRLSTNITINEEAKRELAEEIADRIIILVGKKPERTMVEISDNDYMFFAMNDDPCMKIRLELFKSMDMAFKQEFVRQIVGVISQKTGIPAERIYLTISEYENWSSGGVIR